MVLVINVFCILTKEYTDIDIERNATVDKMFYSLGCFIGSFNTFDESVDNVITLHSV